MIASIQKAYIREYKDTGQVAAYIDWTDRTGKTGRTEGKPDSQHMQALIARARREGVAITSETWGN